MYTYALGYDFFSHPLKLLWSASCKRVGWMGCRQRVASMHPVTSLLIHV